MMMSPGARKLALTAHIVSSLGWMGAAFAYLVMALVTLSGPDPQAVRAAYFLMEPLSRFAIVPLAFASLFTGLVSALGTSWGLFRHYWVMAKLFLTLVATLILMGNMRTLEYLSGLAAQPGAVDSCGLTGQVLHSAGGIIVLLVTAILGVYKPKGLTRYGWKKQRQESAGVKE
jgi:hypothetical protein